MCARRGGGRRLSGKPRPVHAGCARRSVRVSVLRLRSARRLRRFHALDGSGQALRPLPGRRPLGLLTGYRRQSEELSRACEQRLADGLGFASQVRVLERVAELVARLVVVPYVRTTGCPSTRRRSMASIGFDGCGQAAGRRRGWLEQRGVRCVAAIGGCCPGFRGRFTRWVLVFLGALHSVGTWRWALGASGRWRSSWRSVCKSRATRWVHEECVARRGLRPARDRVGPCSCCHG